MQSTLPSVLQELRGTRLYLSDCMSALYESAESQAETAARVPELAGFTMMQQSRRMMQRPLSLQGVEMADGNRFFVHLGSQAETCARPILFENKYRPTFTTQPSEDIDMAAATNTTPFAWDFRADAVDALSMERNFDWPALDEAEYRRPNVPQPARVWSKEPSLSRIPALSARTKKETVEVESLRELLNEAMVRESQRITVRTRAFKPEQSEDECQKESSLASKAKMLFANFKAQFSEFSKTWVRA